MRDKPIKDMQVGQQVAVIWGDYVYLQRIIGETKTCFRIEGNNPNHSYLFNKKDGYVRGFSGFNRPHVKWISDDVLGQVKRQNLRTMRNKIQDGMAKMPLEDVEALWKLLLEHRPALLKAWGIKA